MDFASLLIGFGCGYYVCKKKNSILTFFNSLKFLYNFGKHNNKVYNEFFETDFSESDYVKEVDSLE